MNSVVLSSAWTAWPGSIPLRLPAAAPPRSNSLPTWRRSWPPCIPNSRRQHPACRLPLTPVQIPTRTPSTHQNPLQNRKPRRRWKSNVRSILSQPKLSQDVKEVRLAQIRQAISQPPLGLYAYRQLLSEPLPVVAAAAEDAALIRLFRGYELFGDDEDESADTWEITFRDFWGSTPIDISEAIKEAQHSHSSRRPGDERDWLVGRHGRLRNHRKGTRTIDTVNRVYAALVSLEFAVAWEDVPDTEKESMIMALFCDDPKHSATFAGMSFSQACDKIKEGHQHALKQWRQRFYKYELGPRRKILDLYRKSGIHFLMDPYWCPETLTDGRFSSEWSEMWKDLHHQPPVDASDLRYAVSRHDSNTAATLGVLRALQPALATLAESICSCILTDARIELAHLRNEEP
ncbi:hypothetical protein B0H12DRAFT_1096237 [Mycena haematopus]|nr:hypothetical protein B0H12DRAFT_1096237 [Mycena haematopus]